MQILVYYSIIVCRGDRKDRCACSVYLFSLIAGLVLKDRFCYLYKCNLEISFLSLSHSFDSLYFFHPTQRKLMNRIKNGQQSIYDNYFKLKSYASFQHRFFRDIGMDLTIINLLVTKQNASISHPFSSLPNVTK